MNHRVKRRVGAGVAACLIAGGLAFGPSSANAAVATYTCTGATNDVAATQLFTNFTSAQLLSNLANNIANFPAKPVPATI